MPETISQQELIAELEPRVIELGVVVFREDLQGLVTAAELAWMVFHALEERPEDALSVAMRTVAGFGLDEALRPFEGFTVLRAGGQSPPGPAGVVPHCVEGRAPDGVGESTGNGKEGRAMSGPGKAGQ